MARVKKQNKRIFLDHASTTPVLPEVLKAMKPFFSDLYANPSALYKEGVAMKHVIHIARKNCADILSVHADEIVFTGNGTEADNLALMGIISTIKEQIKNPHIVVSAIEHPAILEMAEQLEKRFAVEVSVVQPNEEGIINPDDVYKALKSNTVLVSVMYANNEIGTIQPIRDIAKVIRLYKKNKKKFQYLPYFHTDASQAANYLPLGVPQLGVDMMTLDASKMYGPKGVGMLYVKRGITLAPLLIGGGQERGLRSGTEFVSGIIGFTTALTLAQRDKEKETKRLKVLQNKIINEIVKYFPNAQLNGSRVERLPNNVNICFPNTDGEFTVIKLDSYGIAVSSSSSCRTLSDSTRSYVIEALGKKNECAESSLRITLGRATSLSDVKYLISTLKKMKSVLS